MAKTHKIPSTVKAPVTATVRNERDLGGRGVYGVAFDLVEDIQLTIPGPAGPAGFDAVASDLLDVALAVYFVERDLRRPAPTNRVREIAVRLPVREPALWKPVAPTLEDLLGFLGGHGWRVSFSKSPLPAHKASSTAEEERSRVALHSGGVDGTCGLGWLKKKGPGVQLASFYTSQRKLQGEIAGELGFDPPSSLRAVWKDRKSRRGRGGFAYRSFLFLSLGAAVARSFRAREVLQFENGFLAAAIPPSPSYFPTRHAHPRYHRLFGELAAGLGWELEVDNPFRWWTKRQAVEELRRAFPEVDIDPLLARTQSCWYFNYNQFPSRFERERIALPSREHCGACVPCLVRRAALEDSAYTLDPTAPPEGVRDPRNVSYNYDAYKAFCDLVSAHGGSPAELRRAFLRRGIVVDREAGPWDRLQPLVVRFADELLETFA
jgi:7-cyano-7-deazaguanine synthase in queuosine biosynthesis